MTHRKDPRLGAEPPDGEPIPRIAVIDTQLHPTPQPERVARLAEFVLAAEGSGGQVSIAFVDDDAIADLHVRFMGIAGPTDVLTFDLRDATDVASADLGEIVISVDTARRHADREGTTAEYECLLYVVHGLLHLLGFDDQQEEDAVRMAARQTELLSSFMETDSRG